ncbi:SPOR domain-containing protein, partial [Clostridium perfringens]|uniref:SPOR domain-containing protein n=1 Tax=Clostridium perfringens TaxID=1502 RepID=UPI002ACC27FF
TESFSMRTTGVALSGTDYYKENRQSWSKGISLTILEVGFIDTNDINIILKNVEEIGFIIAQELAKLCDKTVTRPVDPAPSTGVKYRVVCGTFANKDNAIEQQEKLKKAGFDSFLVAV